MGFSFADILQHDYTDTAHLGLVRRILLIHAAGYR